MNRRFFILVLALIGLLFVAGCSSSGATGTTPPTSNEDNSSSSGGDTNKGEIFVAATSDVDPKVKTAIEETLKLAKAELGLDWNMDYYVIGADKAAAQDLLVNTYCPRGKQQGRYESSTQPRTCLNMNPKEKIAVDPENKPNEKSYVGFMGYHAQSVAGAGSMARGGMAPMHVMYSTIPVGLNDPSSSVAADTELAIVLHEFWHGVQAEHTGATPRQGELQEDAVFRSMGDNWFVEGSAEYMGQYLRAKFRANNTLPADTGNTSTTHSYTTTMENYAKELKTGSERDNEDPSGTKCKDRKLLSFEKGAYYSNDACVPYGITLGTWAMAYFHSLNGVSQDTLIKTLHPAVKKDGSEDAWKQAFEAAAGMKLTEFETEFHTWLDTTSVSDMMKVLPSP
jgi:hypothetical protein